MPHENSEQPQSSQKPGRIYTRLGDHGLTRLASGREVAKNHPRLDAYGTLDELQVAIGAARDAFVQTRQAHPGLDLALLKTLDAHLVYIQNMIFALCADLATPLEDRRPGLPQITSGHIDYLEQLIDTLTRELPPLTAFILPGGHPAATSLHVCRVICRRAERRIEDLAAAEPLGDAVRPFVNRLSDAFFVLARRVRLELGRAGIAIDEQTWQKDLNPPPLK